MALVFGDISIGDWANCEVKTDRTKKRNNKKCPLVKLTLDKSIKPSFGP